MSENTPESTEEERRRLEEQGRKFLEKRRRNAATYRKKLREEGIVSATIRIEKEDLDRIRAVAELSGRTINETFLSFINEGFSRRRGILEGYVRGEVSQATAITLLSLRRPQDLSRLLAIEGLPIPL